MNESLPPTGYSEAFKSSLDMFDFLDLVQIDPVWGAIYDPRYETIEGPEHDLRKSAALEFIQGPTFKDHLIGLLYFYEVRDNKWVSPSLIFSKFSGYGYSACPIEVQNAVKGAISDLIQEDIITSCGASFILGSQAPLDEFPKLDEDFEQWTFDYLSGCGGRSRPRHIVLEHFAEDIQPFEFWGAMRKLQEMAKDGLLNLNKDTYLLELPRQEDPELAVLMSSIEDLTGLGTESAQDSIVVERQLRTLGKSAIRKPIQRGRGW